MRCLESAAVANHEIKAGSAVTRVYMRPGSEFKVVDALVTNFHMPRSSLLILVSAFAGVDPIRSAYQGALDRDYRFLSFGDAMFIEKARSSD
jgi:S-adenosylmethionine:tRNA ribosyltransferase-isomerase